MSFARQMGVSAFSFAKSCEEFPLLERETLLQIEIFFINVNFLIKEKLLLHFESFSCLCCSSTTTFSSK